MRPTRGSKRKSESGNESTDAQEVAAICETPFELRTQPEKLRQVAESWDKE